MVFTCNSLKPVVGTMCLYSIVLFSLPINQSWASDAQEQSLQEFSIPSQLLNEAINSFVETTGWQVGFVSDQANDVRSNSVQGKFTKTQALKKLLEGTDIQYRHLEKDSITLQKKTNELTTELLLAQAPKENYPVTKIDSSEYDGPVEQEDLTVSGRELNSYNVLNANTATKTDTPIMETPMSIQVVPKSLIDDQQAFTLQEVLKNVPGIQTAFGFSGPFQQSILLRGFTTEFQTTGGISYREGVRLKAAVPVASLERIEVLKGPASVLYGRAVPGGLINYIPKDPLYEPHYSIQQQFGSYDLYRTSVDATGPLNESGTLRYRFNLEYADSNSFIKGVSTEFIDVAPTITWDITPDTQLEIEFQYNKQEFSPEHGVPAIGNRPAKLSRNFNVTEGIERDETGTRLVDVDLTHKFNDNWKVHLKGLYAQYDYDIDDQVFGFDLNETTGEFSRFSFEEDDDGEVGFVSLDVTGKLDVFGMTHTLLVGADYYDEDTESIIAFPDNTSINIFNPVFGTALRTEFTADNTLSFPYINKWWGIYLQDQIDVLDNLHILIGGRYDNTEALFDVEGVEPNKYDDFSPRYGVVYQPWTWLSLYGSYSESFQTNNGRSGDGSSFDPETAEQFEFGLKTDVLDGRLSSTLAFFNLTKENVLTDNPNTIDPTDSSTVGEARSRGIELSITGQITDNLKLVGQYAYIDTEITKDNNGNLGNRLPQAALHSGSLWTTYDVSTDFKLGVGAYAVGSRSVDEANSAQMPGYVRMDIMASYGWKIGGGRLTTQLNINNLLDKEYFTGAFDRFSIVRGEPITVLGSLKFEY